MTPRTRSKIILAFSKFTDRIERIGDGGEPLDREVVAKLTADVRRAIAKRCFLVDYEESVGAESGERSSWTI